MGQLQFNGGAPYKPTGIGGYVPPTPVMPNMGINDYLNTLKVTPSLNLPALNPAGLAFADGVPLAPTVGGASNFSNGGFNLDILNPEQSIEGNPLGLKLGAEAGGGLPKIAMTDKINAGVGVFNAALGAISAYKALKLGKENLAFQKESFNKNFEASKNTTNAQLENAQRVRVSADPTSAMSVADYMAKYGVK